MHFLICIFYRFVVFYIYMLLGFLSRMHDLYTNKNGKWVYDLAVKHLLVNGYMTVGQWNPDLGTIDRMHTRTHHFEDQLLRIPHVASALLVAFSNMVSTMVPILQTLSPPMRVTSIAT